MKPLLTSSRSRSRLKPLFYGAAALAALAYRRRHKAQLTQEFFRGRVVLITGGSRGLGFIMATQLARAGAKISICARTQETLDQAREKLLAEGAQDVVALRCDVSEREEVAHWIRSTHEELGPIDVLICNASIIQVGPQEVMNLKDFQDAMNVNYWGMFFAIREALPYFRDRPGNRIVNITSIGGVVAVPHLLPYTAAKFAAVGLSLGLREELGKIGISVCTVVPGLMRTGSFLNALFKGKREKEFGWFSVSSSAPIMAMDAERAAAKILQACASGRSWLVLSFPAKLLRMVYQLAPRLSLASFDAVNRLMPGSDASEALRMPGPGYRYRTGLVTSERLTYLGDRAAEKYNEKKPG